MNLGIKSFLRRPDAEEDKAPIPTKRKAGQPITVIIKHDMANRGGRIEILSAKYIKRGRGRRQAEHYKLANGHKIDPSEEKGGDQYMDINGKPVLFVRSPSPQEYTITTWDDREIKTMTESTKKRVFFEMKQILDRRRNKDWWREASPFIFFLIFCVGIIAMFKVAYPVIADVEKDALDQATSGIRLFVVGGMEFNQTVHEFKNIVEALGAEVAPLIPPNATRGVN